MPGPYDINTTGSQLTAELAPLIKGKTILTTGVSLNGLGAHFVQTIAAAQPALLILAGRSLPKARATANAIAARHPGVRTRLLELDLGSLAAVRRAADEVLSWGDDDVPAVDVLVNNAGVMALGEWTLSEDGVEAQFASNHLGHFLFANLIMGKLLAAGEPRVVSVSSSGHSYGWVRFHDVNFDNGATYNKWVAYGQSKTANMLFAISLAEKLGKRGLLAFSVHPGTIVTQLAAHLDYSEGGDVAYLKKFNRERGLQWGFKDGVPRVTPDQGVATHVLASFDPSLKDHNGAYLLQSRVADPYTDEVMPWATSKIEADKLWKLSEKMVGQEFNY